MSKQEYLSNRKQRIRYSRPDKPNKLHYWDWYANKRRKGLIDITCEEWRNWWIETGEWVNRGRNSGNCFMSRIDKSLPFSLDNIELKWRGKKK